MRTIKDPKKKPDVRRRTDLDEEDQDVRLTKSTPPKKRRAAKAKDDSSSSLNDSGSFADNQSDIVSERSSVIGEDDASDISSLKSTPPKKRGYHKIGTKGPEINGDLNAEPEPEKKFKGRKPAKKDVSNEETVKDDKKAVVEKKPPKGRRKVLKASEEAAESEPKSTKASNDAEKTPSKTKKGSPPSKKTDPKPKQIDQEPAEDAEPLQKTPPKRKRKLSGPTGDEVPVKDKKVKGKKDKLDNESEINENNTPTQPKPKAKPEKKSKKQIQKEQAQLELKRQTEEQRNSHSEKGGCSPQSIESESKAVDSQVVPHKAPTPKKKAIKKLDKVISKAEPEKKRPELKTQTNKSEPEKTKTESNAVNHVLSEADAEARALDNAIRSIEEVSKEHYVLSIPDDLRSDEEHSDEDDDDSSSDLDTSFDSINSDRSKLESVGDTKIGINDTSNLESKPDDPSHEGNERTKDEQLNRSIDGQPELSIKCEGCGYISRSKGGHTRHLRKCQPGRLGLDASGEKKVIKLHKCEQCEYSAPRRVLVINHMKVHGIFQCKRCTYRTDCEEALDDHSGQEHKDRSDCKFCKLCNRYVKCSEVPLEKHMEECQGRVPFKCPECEKEFQYESSLKCHVVSHYPDQPKLFACEQCDYKSNYKANLKKHVRHIHEQRGEKSIKCPQCEKCFHTEDNMRRHQKLHSTDRPHKCDQDNCDKAFKTFNGLKLHMTSHQTEKLHMCEVEECTQGFKTNQALGKHISDEHQNAPKTFSCPEEGCTMAYYMKCHLERHVEAHKENKGSYFCTWPTCTKALKSEEIMRAHLLIHTDEKPLKCEHCDYVCRQKSSLRFHMRKKHPELLPPTPAADLKSPKPSKKGSLLSDSIGDDQDIQDNEMPDARDDHENELVGEHTKDPVEHSEFSPRLSGSSTPIRTYSVVKDSRTSEKSSSTASSSDTGNISTSTSVQHPPLHHRHPPKDFLIQNHIASSVRENKENVPSNNVEDRTSVVNQTKPDSLVKAEQTGVLSGASSTAEGSAKKPKKTDMYDFQSEEESGDEMKPGLLRKEYDKDKPPLPSVTHTVDPSLLTPLDLPPAEEEEEDEKADVKKEEVKETKSPKGKRKPGPKAKPKAEKPEKPKPEKLKPEKTKPEKVKPEKPKPEKTKPEKTKPEKSKPEKAEPEKAEPVKNIAEKVKSRKGKLAKLDKGKSEKAQIIEEETDPEPEPEVKQVRKRGRRKKSDIVKEQEKKPAVEQVESKPATPKGKRGRSPKAKKVVEEKKDDTADEEDEPVAPVKKKRGPKKKVKEAVKEEEKAPKKRGRKKRAVHEKEEDDKEEIEPENGDATINYSEVESSEMFADSRDSVTVQTPEVSQAKPDEPSDRPDDVNEEDNLDKDEKDAFGFSAKDFEDDNLKKPTAEVDKEINDADEPNVAEEIDNAEEINKTEKVNAVENNDERDNDERDNDERDNDADEDKKSSDLDSDSSDIGSDFDEDLKPPPAPRPPPMYDSEDGDIESGPENEDFNGSAMSNEPLRDFESSRDLSKEIARDFESSRDLNDSVKTNEVHSVEVSTPKDIDGTPITPSSVNPLRNDSVGNDYDNQETPYPQSHHSSVSHTPSHNSVPPTPVANQEYESHGIENQVGERMIKSTVQGQTNDENTDESSMPEVDKDYVGRFFEEIQCTQTAEGQINRINSIDESSKTQEKIVETSQSDSGVPSSLTSNQTDSSMQMQSPPTDLSMKRMDILSSDRPADDYQPRSVGSDHRSSDQRIPSVPSFEPQYNPLDPYSSTVPPRETILRQTEKSQSPTNLSNPATNPTATIPAANPAANPAGTANPPNFMRFPPESEAVLQRQRMSTPYDRNIQNLHRIGESSLPQHNSSSPLLRHVPGREDMFPSAAGVGGSMSRNPFHSSWSGQDVRPPHWGHPTYLQRPLDQQSGSSSSLFGKDSYLPGREFMFDPSRVADRNMLHVSSLASSAHAQRPDIPDTFQLDRYDLGTYLSSHGYNAAPVDYTRSAAGSATQKSLDERYRQTSTGVSDYRSLPQTSSSDMFSMNSSFNLDKFYPRDAMFHSQHITDNTNSRFLQGVAAQHSMFGRDYAHPSLYAQNSPYPFMNMNDKNYTAATAKLAHTGSAVGQQRELVPVPRPNMSAPDPQLQDPYRHHSSMLYNMMNRYFD